MTTRTIASVAATAFGGLALFQLALALGAPLGDAAWGGAQETLTPGLRVGSAVSVLFYMLAIGVILRRAGMNVPWVASGVARIGAWALVVSCCCPRWVTSRRRAAGSGTSWLRSPSSSRPCASWSPGVLHTTLSPPSSATSSRALASALTRLAHLRAPSSAQRSGDSTRPRCHDARAETPPGHAFRRDGKGPTMLVRSIVALRQRWKGRRRRPRQPGLLAGGPAPDPRRPQQSLDPNARFIGEQMGSGGEG